MLQPGEVIDAKWVSQTEYEEFYDKELMAPPVRDFWEIFGRSSSGAFTEF
jgi:hypothetical protein